MGCETRYRGGDRLDVSVTLVEECEQKRYHIAPPDPVEAIKFRMDQLGLKAFDLARILGAKLRIGSAEQE
jgi:HTH-type transcriptional regulator/antitoxin HigA